LVSVWANHIKISACQYATVLAATNLDGILARFLKWNIRPANHEFGNLERITEFHRAPHANYRFVITYAQEPHLNLLLAVASRHSNVYVQLPMQTGELL